MRLWDLGIGDWEDWGSGDSGGWKDQGIGGSEGSRGGGLGVGGIRGIGELGGLVGSGDWGSGIRDIYITSTAIFFSETYQWGIGGLGIRRPGNQDIYFTSKAIFFTETYQILTREMTDVATEVYNFNYYANNSFFYTYGNVYNTYSYYTEQDFKRTLDYIAFRKPRMQDNLDIKVLDWR